MLLRLSGRRFAGPGNSEPADVLITQAELADAASLSLNSIGSMLKRLSERGLIELGRRGRIICFPETLRSFVDIDALDGSTKRGLARAAADGRKIIVGAFTAGGTCHYMVQDDSGEGCVNFYPHLHDRCTHGRIRLTRPELRTTLHRVTYLR